MSLDIVWINFVKRGACFCACAVCGGAESKRLTKNEMLKKKINTLFTHLDWSNCAETISPEAQEHYVVKLFNNFNKKSVIFISTRWDIDGRTTQHSGQILITLICVRLSNHISRFFHQSCLRPISHFEYNIASIKYNHDFSLSNFDFRKSQFSFHIDNRF